MKLQSEIMTKYDSIQGIIIDALGVALTMPYMNYQDLLRHIEQIEQIKGFAAARIKAETPPKNNKKELSIDQIYEHMPIKYQKYKIQEIRNIAQLCYANPEIKAIYEYMLARGKKVKVLIDNYLPYSLLQQIMFKNGYRKIEIIPKLMDSEEKLLYISTKRYKRKIKNIEHKKYISLSTKFITQNQRARLFMQYYHQNIDTSILMKNIAISQFLHKKENFWYNLGYLYIAPLYDAYIREIEQTMFKKGIKEIWFLSKQNSLLPKLFTFLGHNYIKIKTIETHHQDLLKMRKEYLRQQIMIVPELEKCYPLIRRIYCPKTIAEAQIIEKSIINFINENKQRSSIGISSQQVVTWIRWLIMHPTQSEICYLGLKPVSRWAKITYTFENLIQNGKKYICIIIKRLKLENKTLKEYRSIDFKEKVIIK